MESTGKPVRTEIQEIKWYEETPWRTRWYIRNCSQMTKSTLIRNYEDLSQMYDNVELTYECEQGNPKAQEFRSDIYHAMEEIKKYVDVPYDELPVTE